LWVGTVKIVVRLENGTTAEFFKKGAPGSVGADMMKGTFEAENALYTFLPESVPRPVAWGTYHNDPDTHFYMCAFVDMEDEVPKPDAWASTVASLHLNSMGKSPTGEFGFPVATHLANVPVDNTWNHSWQAFWAQQMTSLFDQEARTNGPNQELAALRQAFFDKAIPRYLGPLESEGRLVIPTLIHSDLWPGNIKPMASEDSRASLCMFDACAYWGHNEADLGICRNTRYKLGQPCIQEYHRLVPVSEPVEDFDGRNAVYAMKYHVLLSVMYKGGAFRKVLIDELMALLGKVDNDASVASHL